MGAAGRGLDRGKEAGERTGSREEVAAAERRGGVRWEESMGSDLGFGLRVGVSLFHFIFFFFSR